jgi:uncharacterized protein
MTILYDFKCPDCGSSISSAQADKCDNCGAIFKSSQVNEPLAQTPDPDHPAWSLSSAIGMWIFSVFAIIFAPLPASFIWMALQSNRGVNVNNIDLRELTKNPTYVLIFILSTFVAQLITLLVAYLLITKKSSQGFFASLGWHWHPRFRLLQSFLFTIFVIILAVIIANILPNNQTDLEKLLNVSLSVRIVIAILAVVSAPLVEEVIYRGLLYSGLRKNIGIWPSIIIVSLIFTGVHVPQYWGGWAILASLSMLSFGLTVVRAFTGSLLPSYTIHLFFNTVNAIGIIVEGVLKKT